MYVCICMCVYLCIYDQPSGSVAHIFLWTTRLNPTALKKSTHSKLNPLYFSIFLLFCFLPYGVSYIYNTIHLKYIPKSHSGILIFPLFKPINSNIFNLLSIIDYSFQFSITIATALFWPSSYFKWDIASISQVYQ